MILMLAGAIFACGGQPVVGAAPDSRPFAVVELFTSEGCSSCPPADRFLAELSGDAVQSGGRLFPLAFHVDYWDHLGWKDPFASAEFSRRQRDYSPTFPGAGVYTPQMIINGHEQLVGSDRTGARRIIGAAMKAPARLGVAAQAMRADDGVTVSYTLSEAWSGVVNAALVERGLSTEVKRGENAGSTLKHENVVRAFQTVMPGRTREKEGSIVLHPPQGTNLDRCSVVVYAQDSKTREVLGAAGARIAVPVPSRR